MQLIHLAPVIHGSSSSAQEHAERSSGTLRRSMCLTESVVGIPWWRGGDGVSDTLGGGVGLGRVISYAIGTLACMCVPLSVDGTVVCLARAEELRARGSSSLTLSLRGRGGQSHHSSPVVSDSPDATVQGGALRKRKRCRAEKKLSRGATAARERYVPGSYSRKIRAGGKTRATRTSVLRRGCVL